MKKTEKEDKKQKADKKGSHKKRNVIIFTIIAAFIIITLLIALLGIRVNFLINDELKIRLTPLDKNIITTYGQEKNISFQFENDNNIFCESKCTYQFLDISNNTIIDQDTLILKSKTNITKSYRLLPSKYGSGQEIYSFQVTCNNIKSFMCATSQGEQFKSSFITLSYDLSEEEKNKITIINYELKSFLNESSLLDIKNQRLGYIFFHSYDTLKNTFLNQEVSLLKDSLVGINSSFGNLAKNSSDMLNYWEHNQFAQLTPLLKSGNDSLLNLSMNLKEGQIKVYDLIDTYNNIINSIQRLVNKSSVINSIINYYNLTNNINLKNQAIDFKKNLSEISSLFYDAKNPDKDRLTNKISDLSSKIDYLINTTNATLSSTNETLINVNFILIDKDVNKSFFTSIQTDIRPKDPICCVFGKCKKCCTIETCKDDPRLYPVLFIHGHAFNKDTSPETSLNSFAKIQRKLQDEGIINAGQIDLQNLEDIPAGEYGKSGSPISVRASYYYIHFYDLVSYSITSQKSERIENYALRLNEIINVLKDRTGSEKINIVAHSMGGLVAREYLNIFGEESVDKLILIATPNSGISDKARQYCDFLGSQKECEDMTENSVFMKRISTFTPKKARVYTISGTGCLTDNQDGDGIVKQKNVILKYAKNSNVNGSCLDVFKVSLHQGIIDPDKYLESYNIIKNILKE